ncbi:MAG: hypothetical protein P8X96_17550 [Desulfobacteraceae bacterium]
MKKARERVEKRLRQRMEARVKDDRYEQTLDIAKKITSGSIHKSQDPLLRALEEKLENTPMDPSDNPDIETDDPVLLEQMVGIQHHYGKDDTDSKNEAFENQPSSASAADTSIKPLNAAGPTETKASETNPAVPEAVKMESVTTANEMDKANIDTKDVPESGPADDIAYPKDVKVETVLLESKLEHTDMPAKPDEANETISEDDEKDPPQTYIAAASTATLFGGNLTRLLPMVAWLILVTGLVGAVLSWTTISDVEAGVTMTTDNGSAHRLPLGLLLGFAYLATGALGFAFFWVSSAINRLLKDIRQILTLRQDVPEGELLPSTVPE